MIHMQEVQAAAYLVLCFDYTETILSALNVLQCNLKESTK